MIEYTHLKEAMEAYGWEVTRRYRSALASKGIDATTKLSSTAHPMLRQTGGIFTLYLALQDYWKYVEYGTRAAAGHAQGNRPPVAPFVAWIRAKGIPYKGNSPLPLAYAISHKVWKTGTVPKNVLGPCTYDVEMVAQRFQDAAEQDTMEAWQQIFEDLGF